MVSTLKSSVGFVCDAMRGAGEGARVLLTIFVLMAAMPVLAQHSATAQSDDKPSADHGAGSMGNHAADQA
ncbi:MAG: hypothetical protein WA609_19450, partial [Terriglobales bacterium]